MTDLLTQEVIERLKARVCTCAHCDEAGHVADARTILAVLEAAPEWAAAHRDFWASDESTARTNRLHKAEKRLLALISVEVPE